jgi:tetratricopeptide (TPR) repeat protein
LIVVVAILHCNVRRYREAIASFADASSLHPEAPEIHFSVALATTCGVTFRAQSPPANAAQIPGATSGAGPYDKLGRRSGAEGELAKRKSALGDSAAYQYAAIYAQWGNRAKALECLDTAMRLRDGVGSKTAPSGLWGANC